jgi:plasmid stability protein
MLVHIQVLFDEETLRSLQVAAEEQGRSVSDLVRELVENGLEHQRQQELVRLEESSAKLRQIREERSRELGE